MWGGSNSMGTYGGFPIEVVERLAAPQKRIVSICRKNGSSTISFEYPPTVHTTNMNSHQNITPLMRRRFGVLWRGDFLPKAISHQMDGYERQLGTQLIQPSRFLSEQRQHNQSTRYMSRSIRDG